MEIFACYLGGMKRDLSELAIELNAAHEAATTAIGSALLHARHAGELLVEAKTQVAHGEFKPWLARHFHGSYRTAAVYMRIVRRWPAIEAKVQTSAPLSIDGAVRLLAVPQTRLPAPVQTFDGGGGEESQRMMRLANEMECALDGIRLSGIDHPTVGYALWGFGGKANRGKNVVITPVDEVLAPAPDAQPCPCHVRVHHFMGDTDGFTSGTKRPVPFWLVPYWIDRNCGYYDWEGAQWVESPANGRRSDDNRE